MAKQPKEIRVKLIVDGKEAQASIKFTDKDMQQLIQTFQKAKYSGAEVGKEVASGFENARNVIQGVQAVLSQLHSQFAEPISVYLDKEETEIAFGVLLGSSEKAHLMLNQLNETFGALAPQFRKNAQLLLNFGIAADEVVPNLKMLGDITGGNVQRMESLALAFAQSSSAGRLTGQDLMQMINAGFNPLQEIAVKTGKSISVLKDEMAKGKIPFEMVRQAFADATSEGGKFFGMLEKQSAGSGGSLRQFDASLRTVKEHTGEFVMTALTPLLNITSDLINELNEFSPTLLKISGGIATLTLAVVTLRTTGLFPAITTFNITQAVMERYRYQMHLAALSNVNASKSFIMLRSSVQGFFASLGPGGWLLLGLSAYIGYTALAKSGSDEVTESFSEQEKQLRKNQAEFNNLITILKDEKAAQDKRKEAFVELKKEYPDYIKNLNSEKDNIKKIEEAQRNANIEFEKKIKLMAQERVLGEYYNKIAELEYEKIKSQQKLVEMQKQFDEGNKSRGFSITALENKIKDLDEQINTTSESAVKFKLQMDNIDLKKTSSGENLADDKLLKQQEKLRQELIVRSKKDRERELADLDFKYAEMRKTASGNNELMKMVEEQYQIDRIEIIKKYNLIEERLMKDLVIKTREIMRNKKHLPLPVQDVKETPFDPLANDKMLEQERNNWMQTNREAMAVISGIGAAQNEMWNQFIIKSREAKDEWDAVWLAMRNTALQRIGEILYDQLTLFLIDLLAASFGGDSGFTKLITKFAGVGSTAGAASDVSSVGNSVDRIINNPGKLNIGFIDENMKNIVNTLENFNYKIKGEDIVLSYDRTALRINNTKL